jgi:hypothetical protein
MFFQEFHIRLYGKNSESDYFCFPPPKSEYFFQQYWESEYFFRKKPYFSELFLAIVETSSGFRSSYYWTDWNWANTENIRIGLVFAVLAQCKFLYCIDRFDHIKVNKSKLINNIASLLCLTMDLCPI